MVGRESENPWKLAIWGGALAFGGAGLYFYGIGGLLALGTAGALVGLLVGLVRWNGDRG